MPELKPWEKAAQAKELKPWEAAALKKKDSSPESESGVETLKSGLNSFPSSQSPTAPQILTTKEQDKYVQKNKAKKQNLSDRLNKATGAYRAAQGDQAADAIEQIQPDQDTLSVPEEAPAFTESVSNTFDNFITSLKGTAPRLSLLAGQALEKTIGKELTDGLAALPRIEWDSDGIDIVTGRTSDEIRNDAIANLDKLASERKATSGIVESASNFDIPGMAAGVVDAVGAIASTIVPAAVSGGSLLVSDMVGGGLYDYNSAKAKSKGVTTEELFEKGEADFGVPAIIGGIAFGLEKIGLKGVKAALNKKLTGPAAKKASALFFEWNKEGATEFVQVGLDAANKAIAEGKNPDEVADVVWDKMFSKEGLESYLMGVIGSGATSGMGRLAKSVVSPSAKAAISEETAKVERMSSEIINPDASPEAKAFLEKQIRSTAGKIAETINDDIENIEKFGSQQKKEIESLSSEIAATETVLEDPAVSAETKVLAEQENAELNKELEKKLKEEPKLSPLDKAETDLEALKQVNDKTKKYEASLKRLSEAKNSGEITENEFNDMKSRFDDVIGESAPATAPIVESNIEQDAIQEQIADEIPVQPASEVSGEVAEGIPGPGPEVPSPESESVPEQPEATALKNADIEAKRKELGFDPFEAVDPQSFKTLKDETTAKIKEEGFDAKQLIDDVLNKGKAVTAEDEVALKQYQLAKENELLTVNGNITKTLDNPTALKDLISQRDIVLNELNDSQQAGKRAGTITARALNARKLAMLQDFSLAGMFIRKFNANNDQALTEEQKQEVVKTYETFKAKEAEYEAKQAELEAKIAELETKNVDTLSDKAYEKMLREQRKEGRNRKKEEIKKDIDATLEALRKKAKKQQSTLSSNPIPLEAIPDLLKLAKLYAESGVVSVQQVVDNIYAQLKDSIQGLTPDHVKAVIAQGENSNTDDSRLKSFKTRTKNRIDELRNRTATQDFKKKKREILLLDEEALALRDELQKIKYDYEVALYKDELANRTPEQKVWGILAETSGLFRAAKSTADISAVLRQGLVRTVSNTISRNPTKGVKMIFEMLRQTVSEKRYNRWLYDLQSSPEFIKMKDAGLYIADTKNPKLTAKEEAFQSNWINMIPYYGKEGPLPKGASKVIKKLTGAEITKIGGIVKGSERAYASYLNMQRVDVFMKLAQQMEANGKTFESDPKAFKEAAKFANEVTGRGDLGPVESWKSFLSFSLFSPRLIASRVRLLTNLVNPVWWANTPKEVKLEYTKDLGKLALAAATVLWAAQQYGYDVEDDPTSSDFLKLKDGDTRLDVLGGFVQYMVFEERMRQGEIKNSFGEAVDLTQPDNSFDPDRGGLMLRFAESKVSPFVGITLNLARGKDYLGNKYSYKDVWKEVLPLSASDKVVSMIDDDPSKLQVPYKYLPFSLLGVGTSAYKSAEKEFPASDYVRSEDGQKIELTKEQLAERQKYNDEFIKEYAGEVGEAMTESGKLKSEVHKSLKARANKYSEARLKEKYPELIK